MAFYWTTNQKPFNPHHSSGWTNAVGLIAFVLMAWLGVFALLP